MVKTCMLYTCTMLQVCMCVCVCFAVGDFQVVHQSPPDVHLPDWEEAVPLYCVASTHSLAHTYQWENSGEAITGSTPVLWVNKPGVYKCTIKGPEVSCPVECCSRGITVHGIITCPLCYGHGN